MYLIVLPTPVAKSPWTLSKTNSLFPLTAPIENLMSLPSELTPTDVIPTTSPITYPLPPFAMVAADATPLVIVRLAVAFLPKPVTVLREIFW